MAQRKEVYVCKALGWRHKESAVGRDLAGLCLCPHLAEGEHVKGLWQATPRSTSPMWLQSCLSGGTLALGSPDQAYLTRENKTAGLHWDSLDLNSQQHTAGMEKMREVLFI